MCEGRAIMGIGKNAVFEYYILCEDDNAASKPGHLGFSSKIFFMDICLKIGFGWDAILGCMHV